MATFDLEFGGVLHARDGKCQRRAVFCAAAATVRRQADPQTAEIMA